MNQRQFNNACLCACSAGATLASNRSTRAQLAIAVYLLAIGDASMRKSGALKDGDTEI